MPKKEAASDLDIFADLGGLISDLNASEAKTAPKQETRVIELPLNKPASNVQSPVSEAVESQKTSKRSRSEEFVTLKFEVPKEDYKEFMRIFNALQYKLDARINLAQLGRGWVTRFITAEVELMTAADNHGPLKTPNRRDIKDVAEVDQAMAQMQASAFRRAKPVR